MPSQEVNSKHHHPPLLFYLPSHRHTRMHKLPFSDGRARRGRRTTKRHSDHQFYGPWKSLLGGWLCMYVCVCGALRGKDYLVTPTWETCLLSHRQDNNGVWDVQPDMHKPPHTHMHAAFKCTTEHANHEWIIFTCLTRSCVHAKERERVSRVFNPLEVNWIGPKKWEKTLLGIASQWKVYIQSLAS